MNWGDERYVRLYVRDTVNWVLLGWESQALFALIMRKLDRAGLLDLGSHGMRGLSALSGIPLDVIERAIKPLMADGTLELRGTTLVCPNFLEAQEASMTDVQRQKEHRAKVRDVARAKELGLLSEQSEPVTKRDETVTGCHELSQVVTPSLAVPSQPSRAVPICGTAEKAPPANVFGGELFLEQQAVTAIADRRKKPRAIPDTRHHLLIERLRQSFVELRDAELKITGRDTKALADLQRHEPSDDVVDRAWRRGLTHPDRFKRISNLHQLFEKWNDLLDAGPAPPTQGSPDRATGRTGVSGACQLAGCSGSAVGDAWGAKLCGRHLSACHEVLGSAEPGTEAKTVKSWVDQEQRNRGAA